MSTPIREAAVLHVDGAAREPDQAPSLRRDAPDLYRILAPLYDWWTGRYEWLRRRAMELLNLDPGDTVIDVGCGTGSCFSLLAAKVGPEGRIIGIDQSAEMLAEAHARVSRHGWENVLLIESSAEYADIPGCADAALFCATHDILRSPGALAHVLSSLRPGGRVAAAGGKWASLSMLPLNVAVFWEHTPFVSTFEGFDRPWSHLAAFLDHIDVAEVAFGTGYLLVGTTKPSSIGAIAG